MDQPGYTIREIARELSLPESTVRYYRDAFALYLPAWGMGRRRRYPPESMELLRLIAEGYSQNQTREQIEARVQEVAPPVMVARPVPRPTPPPMATVPVMSDPGMSPVMLEDERERRDVMWQIAKEIVRIGERVERQHMILAEIARRLDQQAHRTLTAGEVDTLPAIPPAGGTTRAPDDVEVKLADELSVLREELERERELVEQLRKAKLDIERRATAAEARLEDRG
ncbi:MAG: MerR family transcriptional regulator [Gemmatimonadetes bacterium]|nr:MerR family transcriptional regulator [Gemmatimonadota bacterium]